MKTVAFECKFCNQLYHTEPEMNECELSCMDACEQASIQNNNWVDKEHYMHQVRLRAKYVSDIPDLIKEFIFKIDPDIKLFDIRLDLKFSVNVSTKSTKPFTESNTDKSYLLGFVGNIYWECDKQFIYRNKIDDVIIGLHTENGLVELDNEKNSYKGSCHIFLDDFPLIKLNYENYNNNVDLYHNTVNRLKFELSEKISSDLDLQHLVECSNMLKSDIRNTKIDMEKKILALLVTKMNLVKEYDDIIKDQYYDMNSELNDIYDNIINSDFNNTFITRRLFTDLYKPLD